MPFTVPKDLPTGSGLLTRARSAAELLWKPFQHHFSDVVISLEKHQAWFETEASIHQHATITEHFDSFQDFLKSTETQNDREKYKERAMQEKEYGMSSSLIHAGPSLISRSAQCPST